MPKVLKSVWVWGPLEVGQKAEPGWDLGQLEGGKKANPWWDWGPIEGAQCSTGRTGTRNGHRL